MTEEFGLFISCEHGGNRVPDAYQALFAGQQALLDSHRGYDIGILPFAERLAEHFDAPFLSATVTRLLIDLNRSSASRTLFSELTKPLPAAERQSLLRHYHQPYWKTANEIVAGIIVAGRRVRHLSVHSFTPVLNGERRNTDIGLLYDPQREVEKALCRQWQRDLATRCPTLRVRRNYPYRGNADALVTALRKQFSASDYLGIELEINQSWPLGNPAQWKALQEELLTTIASWFDSSPHSKLV